MHVHNILLKVNGWRTGARGAAAAATAAAATAAAAVMAAARSKGPSIAE